MMINVAFIPFRKGSKRLKNKNLMMFDGEPLYLRTIKQALTQNFSKIYVCTDYCINDLEIPTDKRIILLKRPAAISQSETTTVEVISYFIDKSLIDRFDYLILLQVTSPLRVNDDISRLFLSIKRTLAPSYVSCYAGTQPEKKELGMQKGGVDYVINGALYAVSRDYYLKKRRLVDSNTEIMEMQEDKSVDIDTIDDFDKAQRILRLSSDVEA